LLNDCIDTSSNSNSNEHCVELDDLALAIRELSDSTVGVEESTEEQADSLVQTHQGISNRVDSNRIVKPVIDCIYVDNGQYFDEDAGRHWSSSNWKTVKKIVKGIVQRGEVFVSTLVDPFSKEATGTGESIPVFAVTDIPFWALREFGSCLMKRESEQSSSGTCIEVAERYPAHKRSVKTLGAAIDHWMKRKGLWLSGTSVNNQGSNNSRNGRRLLVPILLYSKKDDRFDMVTLESGTYSVGIGSSTGDSNSGKGRRKY
jgi:hypothetical protein